MADEAYFQKTVAAICRTRAETTAGCGSAVHSAGFGHEFCLCRPPAARSRRPVRRLRQQNVLVRHFTAPRIQNWLRVTIGTPAQMQRFFAALDTAMG